MEIIHSRTARHAKLAAASEVWWTGLDNVKTGAIATFQRLQAAYAGFCAAEKELFPGGFLA